MDLESVMLIWHLDGWMDGWERAEGPDPSLMRIFLLEPREREIERQAGLRLRSETEIAAPMI
jgi:hypothetical protein